MDIAKYTNQVALYEKMIGLDRFGNRTYDAPRNIKVRRVEKTQGRRGTREIRIQPETEYLSREAVTLFSRIDGEEIMQAEEIRAKNGVLLGTKFSPSPPNTLGSTG